MTGETLAEYLRTLFSGTKLDYLHHGSSGSPLFRVLFNSFPIVRVHSGFGATRKEGLELREFRELRCLYSVSDCSVGEE